jgi:chloramphenicol O-acetyltransferase type A
MKEYIDLDRWERRDHFLFFKDFDEPFFGICTEIECTVSYRDAKKRGVSYFLSYLHKALKAANGIREFRYRIEDDRVACYEKIHASPTIDRDDGTFGFGYIDYDEDLITFATRAQTEMERVRNTSGLVPSTGNENVIHFSAIPWIRFTSLSHARNFRFRDSIPKISFGKIVEHEGALSMPLSVHGHHGLMDGSHVGKFLDRFQALMMQ